MFLFKIFKYQLYIFQLEEYEILRFIKAVLHLGLLPKKSLRKDAVWTAKAKAISVITIIIELGVSLGSLILLSEVTGYRLQVTFLIFVFLVSCFLSLLFSFIFLSIAQLILRPVEIYQKRKLVSRAKIKIQEIRDKKQDFIVIGITGSYGKTSMKDVLVGVLKEKFNVAFTPENNNTPLGISRAILNRVNSTTQIFIVEMGEYVRGDVKTLCEIVSPDISIITGINEAHLERYGTMRNAIDTKFEIVENMNHSEKNIVLLNSDDELTLENYGNFTNDKRTIWFGSKNAEKMQIKILKSELNLERPGFDFTLLDSHENRELEIPSHFLGEYIIGNFIAAIEIGKSLGMTLDEIIFSLKNLKPTAHRLEPRNVNNNVLIIDDTYNGNSTGIYAGIELLAKFKDRRKVYVTPGLVETGDRKQEIHFEIGKRLSEVAELVILTRNSSTLFIYQSLIDSGFSKEKIIFYENSKDTYDRLWENIQTGDVVLMQNDWSDNYY